MVPLSFINFHINVHSEERWLSWNEKQFWIVQKYRSHRKHLLAREAEAATWSQRRQMYGGATAAGGGSKIIRPWVAPTMGFPPPMPPLQQPFIPLHVWGHPSMDQSLMHMWPKHLAPAPSPPPRPAAVAWVPSPHPPPPRPPPDPSFWHSHHLRVIYQNLSTSLSRLFFCWLQAHLMCHTRKCY